MYYNHLSLIGDNVSSLIVFGAVLVATSTRSARSTTVHVRCYSKAVT